MITTLPLPFWIHLQLNLEYRLRFLSPCISLLISTNKPYVTLLLLWYDYNDVRKTDILLFDVLCVIKLTPGTIKCLFLFRREVCSESPMT